MHCKKSRVRKVIGASPRTNGMNHYCVRSRIPGNYIVPQGPLPCQVPNVPNSQLTPPSYFHGPAISNERYAGVRNPFMLHRSAPPTTSNAPFGTPHQFRPSGPMSPNLGQNFPGRFQEYHHVDRLSSRMPQFHLPQPHPNLPNHNPRPFSGFPTEARPQFMQPSLTIPPSITNYPNVPPMGLLGAPTGVPPPQSNAKMGLLGAPTGVPPPQSNAKMGLLGAPTGVPPPQSNTKIEVPCMNFIPTVKAGISEWSEHLTPDGNPYYYNAQTKVSVWEKPVGYVLPSVPDMRKPVETQTNVVKETPRKMPDVMPKSVKPKETKTSKEQLMKKYQPRPISSNPVAGTAWCVVWTGNKRVFFYNPSIKHSTWARPRELLGREDVDELVRNCPNIPVKQTENVEVTTSLSQTETPRIRSVTGETNKEKLSTPVKQTENVEATTSLAQTETPRVRSVTRETNKEKLSTPVKQTENVEATTSLSQNKTPRVRSVTRETNKEKLFTGNARNFNDGIPPAKKRKMSDGIDDGIVIEESIKKIEDARQRERKEKEATSMLSRKKDVQRTLAGYLREAEQERERCLHQKAVQEFQSLLIDLVKTSGFTWKEMKKAAKRSDRWDAVAILSDEEMEDLFREHSRHISRRKKIQFSILKKNSHKSLNLNSFVGKI